MREALAVTMCGSRKLTVKVFALKNCPRCPNAKRIAQKVAQKLGVAYVEIDLETPEGQIEGLMNQVMSTPSIALDEDVIARGRVLSELELEKEIKKRLETSDS
ncbi:MAG: thioredoxin family protein [Candidatus Bathyarchaeia archaeon]